MFFLLLYILHLARTFVKLLNKLLILLLYSFIFFSIKRRSPKNNDLKKKNFDLKRKNNYLQ